MNRFADEPVKPKKLVEKGKVILLRRKELGNNCRFIKEAFGPDMRICMPDEVPDDASVIIRWGTTSNIPQQATVFNTASAIHQTVDKSTFRKLCADKGLAPRTWLTIEALQREEEVADTVIVRPQTHERSEGVYVCKSKKDLEAAIRKIGGAYYISEYIPKDREVRVFVVQGRVIMAFEKIPKNKNDVSWGCVEEGQLKYIAWSEWPLKALEVAVKSFNLSKLDFGAVDVMIKKEKDGDKAYMLEINTAPEVWPYYGERLAAAFKYMIEKGKKRLDPLVKWDEWKDYKHPSLN